MMRNSLKIIFAIVLLAFGVVARGQTTPPVTGPDPLKAIALLRGELIDSFNKGDVDRLLSHLDPDVVITWQNAEVCRGPEAVRAYYNKMMKSDHPIVSSLSIDPLVEDRHVYGDWAISQGNLHDKYVLNDGSQFEFDSVFTAAIARRGDVWKVVSFHASVNAFQNPILGIAIKKVSIWVGLGAGVVGILIGAVLSGLWRRRKRTAA